MSLHGARPMSTASSMSHGIGRSLRVSRMNACASGGLELAPCCGWLHLSLGLFCSSEGLEVTNSTPSALLGVIGADRSIFLIG